MTWELHLSGRVQGVGFRPYVYRLALQYQLKGEVRNDPDGVRIHFNASTDQATAFTEDILDQLPRLAIVSEHLLREIEARYFEVFRIVASQRNRPPDLLISPDFALCNDCRDDITDPDNHRYGYAFTTCTNCGPRYAVMSGLPYDRAETTMAAFTMCETCLAEYQDPTNRRYHSQTNSCPDCGVQLRLTDAAGQKLPPDIPTVVRQLRAGNIIAVKATAGYLLCCAGNNAAAIATLRKRKVRPAKPFALLCADEEVISHYAQLSEAARAALRSPVGPIVLLPKKEHHGLPENIAPTSAYFGVMLPNHPLLYLLATAAQMPLIATSANRSGEPIFTDGQEEELTYLADYVLSHNLPIAQAQDDSLLRITEVGRQKIWLRRGRGLAPAIHPTLAQPAGEDLLATGADLKASFSLRARGRAYTSPFLGDLADWNTQRRYQSTLDQLLQLTDCTPQRILTDLHPAYFSHQLGYAFAEGKEIPVQAIQHHEAHFAAILGEHDLLDRAETVLGVVWDGTGYGHDGHIWGGEYFRFQAGRFHRVQHLPYFPHLGGDKMAREPRYAALAWAGELALAQEILRPQFSATEWRNLPIIRKRQRTLTSSMGRLFDAVASLLGISTRQDYEGQAASQLEGLARTAWEALPTIRPYAMDSFAEELIWDIGREPRALIALRFHLTLADWVFAVAREQGVSKIAFSGGCFQNGVLVDILQSSQPPDQQLFFHQELSPNDENISYGQLIHHALCHPQCNHFSTNHPQKISLCA
ncbi:MAG: carbamoyltransferase HypF [Bacteroidota bacterium]